MTSHADDLHSSAGIGHAPPRGARRVLVWDRAVRAFHWLLVGGIAVAWVSGGSGHRLHEITGSAVAALIAFRLLWGIIGSRHARFSDFVTGPFAVLRYFAAHAKSDPSRHPPRHLGHNPAGGYMILALLGAIALICATGAMQLTNAFFGIDWVETLHHYAANSLWVLVALHVLGALTASRIHKESLVAAMVSGWKPLHVEGEQALPLAGRQRRRMKFEHLQVRSLSRQGTALLGSFVAIGAAAGVFITSGRVHQDIAAAPVLAVAPAITVVPAGPTSDKTPVAARVDAKREAATPGKTAGGREKSKQQRAAAPSQIPPAAGRTERNKKSKASAVAEGGGRPRKSATKAAVKVPKAGPSPLPVAQAPALVLPAPYGLGMLPSVHAP